MNKIKQSAITIATGLICTSTMATPAMESSFIFLNEDGKDILKMINSNDGSSLEKLATKLLEENFIQAGKNTLTPLGYAIQKGNVNAVKSIVNKTKSLNAGENVSAIGMAMTLAEMGKPKEQEEIIKFLVEEHNADVNEISFIKQTPLQIGTLHAAPLKIIDYLVEKGADLFKDTKSKVDEETYVTWMSFSNAKIAGYSENDTTEEYAEKLNNTKKVYKELYKLENGNILKSNLIVYAAAVNRQDLIDYYVEKGVDPSPVFERPKEGVHQSPLSETIKHDNYETFTKLLPLSKDQILDDALVIAKFLQKQGEKYVQR